MPFPRRLLNENEVVVLDLRPHWWVLVGSALLLAIALGLAIAVSIVVPGMAHDPVLIVGLVLVVVVLVRFVRRYARWATTNMVLTSERLMLRAGVFAKSASGGRKCFAWCRDRCVSSRPSTSRWPRPAPTRRATSRNLSYK